MQMPTRKLILAFPRAVVREGPQRVRLLPLVVAGTSIMQWRIKLEHEEVQARSGIAQSGLARRRLVCASIARGSSAARLDVVRCLVYETGGRPGRSGLRTGHRLEYGQARRHRDPIRPVA